MSKYIDAEKLKAGIEKRRLSNRYIDTEGYENELLEIIDSLQQEQPDNEDIDKVAQELYEHLYELKRRNNVPTNLYDKQEIIDLWKAGVEYGYNHPKQEQPDFDDVDPKHLVHSHYTKVRETKTGRVFWAEYSSEAAEWYEAGTGKAYSISDVEFVKEQPEVDLEKAALYVYESWMGGTMDDVRRDMDELGKVLNARKEEAK